jgi:hypothetical protein
MNKAYERAQLNGWKGNARMYSLDVPIKYKTWQGDEEREFETNFVIVSAIVDNITGVPETYIFPTNVIGRVLDWGELDGSYRGGLDHAEALRNAGYEITK